MLILYRALKYDYSNPTQGYRFEHYELEDMEWNGNYFEYLAQERRRLPRIGEKCADMTPTWLEQNAINVVLGLLNRLSQNDNGSEELLAYGLHIRARKKQ